MALEGLKRTGGRTVGSKETLRAVAEGRARRVYVAQDADPQVVEPVVDACSQHGVPVEIVETMEQLGKACGIQVGAASAALLEGGS